MLHLAFPLDLGQNMLDPAFSLDLEVQPFDYYSSLVVSFLDPADKIPQNSPPILHGVINQYIMIDMHFIRKMKSEINRITKNTIHQGYEFKMELQMPGIEHHLHENLFY